jgi:hypothetical protein
LVDLLRRIDRKLDIKRGLTLSYDDLALVVASGAYAALQRANLQQLEFQCQEHVARSHSIDEENTRSFREMDATLKSSGMTDSSDASEALARAQRTLMPAKSRSTSTTSLPPAANTPHQ